LAIDLCEIMRLEEELRKLFIVRLGRVKNDLDRLGIACLIGANLLVCWIVGMSACVTDGC
jgi:hypothetical protein